MTDSSNTALASSIGKILLGVGALLGLVSVFCPWHVSGAVCSGELGFGCGTSISDNALGGTGVGPWGWLYLIATLATLAVLTARIFVPPAAHELRRADWLIYITLGTAMAIGALLYLVTAPSGSINGVPGYSYSVRTSWGVLAGLVAALAVVFGGYLTRHEPAPISTRFDPEERHDPPSPLPPVVQERYHPPDPS